MKIYVEIEVQKEYILPTEIISLRATITSWAKIYEMVERGMFPIIKVKSD